ncbi:MAG: type 1 glutamine amidotransferase [Halodesulfurarchaeum sp.]
MTRRPRIALLNAAHEAADTRRNFRREVPADLVEFQVIEEEIPAELDVDAFMVTGSKSSVYWDEPWIRETETWIRDALDSGLPGMGVCFGHQLLARALGGRVEDMGEYELGYREISHESDPLFSGIDPTFLAFTTHSDRVTELPPGAELLAENDAGIQGFRHGESVGVQFHPEYDLETARRIAAEKDVPEAQRERVEASITEANYRRARQAAIVFENFVAGIESRAASD